MGSLGWLAHTLMGPVRHRLWEGLPGPLGQTANRFARPGIFWI